MIGIDPGITGAIAYDGGVIDIPVQENGINRKVKNRIDALATFKLLRSLYDHGEVVVILEDQTYRPVINPKTKALVPGGGASAFSLGDTYGVLRALCLSVGFLVVIVSPTKWKKTIGVTKDKELSLERARLFYPALGDALKRKKDHNRAEALLLRHYGVLTGEPTRCASTGVPSKC